MPQTKSVGGVILNNDNKVLLVHQKKGDYWVLPKGTIEPGEEEMVTLKREIAEETGITDFELLDGFEESIFYQFRGYEGLVEKEVVYYLIKTNSQGKIMQPEEILEIKWCDFEEAFQLLKHENYKNIINKAKSFLKI